MDPLSIFGAGIGGLSSLFGGNNRLSPQELAKYFGINALGADTNKLFALLSGSPFGQFGMQNASLQGSLFGDELRRRGAAIGGSGIGTLASSAASATQAFQQGDFLSNLFAQAHEGAAQNLNARLAAYASGGQAPSKIGALGGAISNAIGQYTLLKGSNPDPIKVAMGAVGPAQFPTSLVGLPARSNSYDFGNLDSLFQPAYGPSRPR